MMRYSVIIPLAVAFIYCIAVVIIANGERHPNPSGNFISLKGMLTFMSTMPTSILLEKIGFMDFSNNLQLGLCILVNAVLLAGVLFGLLKLFHVK